MQSDISTLEVSAITIQLNELRSKFDKDIRHGSDIFELRETYQQIKELECHLRALQWDSENQLMAEESCTPGWM